MSSIFASLLFSFAGLVVGFIGGQLIAWRRHGSLIVPTYHPRSGHRSDFIVGLLIVALAVATLVQGMVNQQQQTDCNNEFRRVISERSSLTQEQNRASADLQRRLIEIGPSEEAGEQRSAAREDYVKRLDEIDAQRSTNPYPDPRC